MKLRIEEIIEQGITLEFNRDKDWLDELFRKERDVDFYFASPMVISLSFNRSGRKIFVNGKIDTSLHLNCTRCAEDFVYPLSEMITYTLIPSDKMSKHHTETELTNEDLELSFYDGEEVDVNQIVKELIFLSIPSYPRCSKSCRGLCAGCGVNLNLDSCQCNRQIGNASFSVIGK